MLLHSLAVLEGEMEGGGEGIKRGRERRRGGGEEKKESGKRATDMEGAVKHGWQKNTDRRSLMGNEV